MTPLGTRNFRKVERETMTKSDLDYDFGMLPKRRLPWYGCSSNFTFQPNYASTSNTFPQNGNLIRKFTSCTTNLRREIYFFFYEFWKSWIVSWSWGEIYDLSWLNIPDIPEEKWRSSPCGNFVKYFGVTSIFVIINKRSCKRPVKIYGIFIFCLSIAILTNHNNLIIRAKYVTQSCLITFHWISSQKR